MKNFFSLFVFFFFFSCFERFCELQEAVAEVLLFASPGMGMWEGVTCSSNPVEHHGTVSGLQQDPVAMFVKLCKMLKPEEILNKKIPEHSLLSWLQSAQKLVAICQYLSCVGEGQCLQYLKRVIPQFGGISSFILKR